MLNNRLFQSSAISLVFIGLNGACGKSESRIEANTITVNNDVATFEGRVNEVNQAVEVVVADEAQANLTAAVSNPYAMTLVYDIKPPSFDNLVVQAASIYINPKGIAVGYNVAGDVQSGAINIFKFEGAKIALKSEVTFSTRDVNGIFWGDKYLYAVGADSAGGGSSYLSRIKIDGHNFSNTVTETSLNGYVGTSVYSIGSLVYTTSGDNGEVAAFDPSTLTKKASFSLFDARAIGYSASSDQMFALSGQPGTLTKISKEGTRISSNVLGGAKTAQSKSTIQVGDSMSLVSLGEAGFSIVCNSDGVVQGSIAAPLATGSAKVFTNAASMYKNLVFAANGEAGVYMYTATPADPSLPSSKCQKISLAQVGYLKFDASVSANSLQFRDGNLIIATGNGGVKVVSVDIPSTLPSVLGGEDNDKGGNDEK